MAEYKKANKIVAVRWIQHSQETPGNQVVQTFFLNVQIHQFDRLVRGNYGMVV